MNNKKRTLLIDDERDLPADKVCRNFHTGLAALKEDGPWDLLLIDFSINSRDEKGKELTGMDIMNFLEENPEYIPKEIECVSDHPLGAKRIRASIWRIFVRGL